MSLDGRLEAVAELIHDRGPLGGIEPHQRLGVGYLNHTDSDAAHCRSSWKLEIGILVEDLLLQVLQLRRRVDANLVGQVFPGTRIGSQRLGLTITAIQRQYLLGPKPLAERVLECQRLQLPQQLAMTPQRKVSIDAAFESGQTQLR